MNSKRFYYFHMKQNKNKREEKEHNFFFQKQKKTFRDLISTLQVSTNKQLGNGIERVVLT